MGLRAAAAERFYDLVKKICITCAGNAAVPSACPDFWSSPSWTVYEGVSVEIGIISCDTGEPAPRDGPRERPFMLSYFAKLFLALSSATTAEAGKKGKKEKKENREVRLR